MHTRWIQWGAFSAVFRTHDRGMSAGGCANDGTCAVVEVWNLPKLYFGAMRSAMQDRARLIPYIYTATRQAYDSGLSLLRPMYYEFPLESMAYSGNPKQAQYMFGDDLMVCPVVVQGNSTTSMATISIWIPPGSWVELGTGVVHQGGSNVVLTRAFDLREIPVFARAGAVIPTIPLVDGQTLGMTQRQYDSLVFSVFPGATSGSTKVYEDDGATTAYVDGKFVAYSCVPQLIVIQARLLGHLFHTLALNHPDRRM
jgi:alpha-glucosidase (family GH31 glycosyl hydrolase)